MFVSVTVSRLRSQKAQQSACIYMEGKKTQCCWVDLIASISRISWVCYMRENEGNIFSLNIA